MADILKENSAPRPPIQTCLNFENSQASNIQSLMIVKKDGTLEEKPLEAKIIKPLSLIYESVSKLLRDKSIIKSKSEEENKKMETVFCAILKLQTTFLSQNNQYDIKANIKDMKLEIEEIIGPDLSQEVEKMLMGMSGILERNFGLLKTRINEIEENLKEAIKDENNRLIYKI